MARMKIIIKEIGIVMLLLLTVSLLLAIIFYDYIPNNKAVPIKIQSYNISADLKEELTDIDFSEQNIIKTYYMDSSSLDLYESTNYYDKGKANPFADYSTNTVASGNNTTTNSSTNTSSTTNSSKGNNIYKNEVYMTTPGKNY